MDDKSIELTEAGSGETREAREDGTAVAIESARDGRPTRVVSSDTEAHAKQASQDSPRGDVSASTIGRMMGLATSTELKLLEGKVDLLTTKLNNIMVRVDKLISQLSNVPSGSDIDRLDIQVGSLKTMIKEALSTFTSAKH